MKGDEGCEGGTDDHGGKEKEGGRYCPFVPPFGQGSAGRTVRSGRKRREEEEGAHLLHSGKFLWKRGERRDAPRKSWMERREEGG